MVITDTGQVSCTDTAPASFNDDLTGVLDDATYAGDAAAGCAMIGGAAATPIPLR